MKTAEALVDDAGLAGMRLDRFVAERMGLFTRSQAKSRVAGLRVNGEPARPSRRLKLGDRVAVDYVDPPAEGLAAEEIPLAILFENDEVVVIDKPQGMVVHPGSGNRSGTLVNALLAHCAGLSQAFGGFEARPGIVHRLDKDTSGVIITAKNPAAHEHLARQFRDHRVRKLYLAVVRGIPRAGAGRVDGSIARSRADRKRFAPVTAGGRRAVTDWRVLRRYDGCSLVLLAPKTGRTHQLRVHLRLLGTPVLGDPLYGGKDARFPGATLMLHAWRLRIVLPGESQEREFRAPLPERFRSLLRDLGTARPRGTG
ncbi:MAG: RluA family pseudouridine synthase [Spirochaetes bacterium]|nr:RluA family pseudouridine synthase [Spirochaetota bacterium]